MDGNLRNEMSTIQLSIDKQENMLQNIRKTINDDDKVSQQIRKSHLFQKDNAAGSGDKKNIK